MNTEKRWRAPIGPIGVGSPQVSDAFSAENLLHVLSLKVRSESWSKQSSRVKADLRQLITRNQVAINFIEALHNARRRIALHWRYPRQQPSALANSQERVARLTIGPHQLED
jgi:hypothetical protein